MELVIDCCNLRGVKSLYIGNKDCVRVGYEVSDWLVSSESGAETGMCDVDVAVQFVY